MPTASKTIANQAAAARRTATSLRSIAAIVAPADFAPDDRNTLLAAARIVETMADQTARRAKTAAREEARYERAYNAALPAATTYVATIPCATTLDKLALIFASLFQANYLEKRMDEGVSGAQLRDTLRAEFYDATRDIATTLAYKIAKNGATLAAENERLDALIAARRSESRVIRLAERVEAAIAVEAGQ